MERKRKNKISQLVRGVGLQDDDQDVAQITDEIQEKYQEELVGFKLTTDPESIVMGMVVKYVTLDLEKIASGVLVGVDRARKGQILRLVLKNPYHNSIWKIKPNKYWLYRRLPRDDGAIFRKLISGVMSAREFKVRLLRGERKIKKKEKEMTLKNIKPKV